MVNKIIGALKKLDCRKAKKDEHLEDQKFIHEVASVVSGTSGSSSSPKEINQWRAKIAQSSMKSYFEGANQAYDQLHRGHVNQPTTSKYVRPPIDSVETTSDREENEPVSFLTIDPTLHEEDYPSLQPTEQHYNAGKGQEETETDPPGLRRVRYTIDENRPFVQGNVSAFMHERQSILSEKSEVVQEMTEFDDSESILYYSQFPNSFISLAETATMNKFNHRDPSASSLSDVAQYQFVEI